MHSSCLGPRIGTLASKALASFLLSLFASNSPALPRHTFEPGYNVRHWTTANGLPSSHIQALFQSSDGYLWVGTQSGLVRLSGNGYQFVLANACTSLAEDSSGTIWIGTPNGLYRWDGARLSTVPVLDSTGNDSSLVSAIIPRRDGGVWARRGNGLVSVLGEQTTFYPSPPCDSVRQLAELKSGEVWMAGVGCLGAWTGPESGFSIPKIDLLPYCSSVFEDRDGAVWVGCEGFKACVYKDGATRIVGTEREQQGPILNFAQDLNGEIWAGGFAGLWVAGASAFVRPFGLPVTNQPVAVLFPEREGGMWVGTEKDGLYLIAPRSVRTLSKVDGLTSEDVWSVCEGKDGAIWIATKLGVSRLSNGELADFGSRQGIKHLRTSAIAADLEGRIWAGSQAATPGEALAVSEDGQIFKTAESLGARLSDVSALAAGPNNSLWIAGGDGTATAGLYGFTNGAFFTYGNSTQSIGGQDGFPYMFIDSRSNLWRSHTTLLRTGPDGAARFEQKQGFGRGLVAIQHEDADGAFWLATERQGVVRIKNHSVSEISVQHGLRSELTLGLVEDDFGRIWFNSHTGLFWVRKAELNEVAEGKRDEVNCIFYGLEDGLATIEGNGGTLPNSCKGRDGKLYFPTARGLAMIDPRSTLFHDRSSPVFIHEAYANGAAFYSNSPDARSNFAFPIVNDARIPPRRSHAIMVRFDCNSFVHPSRLRFRYRLEGKKDWTDAGAQGFAEFHNLRPGSYVFEVSARNSRGVWNPIPARFPFEIQAFFYQTWRFLGAAGATVIALGMALQTYRLRLRRKIFVLEKQAARSQERERISRDLHDDLGASLTRIAMLSDSARRRLDGHDASGQVERISNIARELLESMSSLVWAANPKYDTMESFCGFVRHYASQLFSATDLRFSFSSEIADGSAPMPSELRRDLFLVAKEALNNVLKHSSARDVRLVISHCKSTLVIFIEDDGIGLHENRASEFGNGLRNMRHRVQNSGGSFEVTARQPSGLRLVVTIPLAVGPEVIRTC